MKILAINGSPNKKGNTQNIVDAILKGANENNHSISTLHLYDYQINDCNGCKSAYKIHKEKDCIHNDDFTKKILIAIKEADLIIFGTPVYMGQITGKTKTLLDRFFTFVIENFEIRYLSSKKFITVVTSGAPSETFKDVSDYLKKWLGEFFFKMTFVEGFHIGDFTGESGEEVSGLEKIVEFGKSIKE